jgi:hypothetical protein
MRFACWITKATHARTHSHRHTPTHRIYNTCCFSTATMVTRTRLHVTCSRTLPDLNVKLGGSYCNLTTRIFKVDRSHATSYTGLCFLWMCVTLVDPLTSVVYCPFLTRELVCILRRLHDISKVGYSRYHLKVCLYAEGVLLLINLKAFAQKNLYKFQRLPLVLTKKTNASWAKCKQTFYSIRKFIAGVLSQHQHKRVFFCTS